MPVGSSESLPIPLARVLESESIRLSGMAATTLPARWVVEPEEIADARAVVERLTLVLPEALFTPPAGPPYEPAALADELNALLDRLWTGKRWLSSYYPEQLSQYRKLSPPDSFPYDDVFNLNRQMLDVVCRDGLKSAHDGRLALVFDNIHAVAATHRRTALCISGGGIRSATFALGVLQGLAQRRLLDKFDFLSTVSGGGYIGGWFSSWIRRNPFGVRGVEQQLHESTEARVDPQPVPIRHLRDFSNYLTPKLGALSADTWTLIGIYLRNVLLNWLVLIPLLVSVLAVPRLMTAAVLSSASIGDLGKLHMQDLWSRASLGMHRLFVLLRIDSQPGSLDLQAKTRIALAIGGLALLFAFVYLIRSRPVSQREEQNAKRTNGDFIRKCILPLFIAAISFNLAWAWYRTVPGNETPSVRWFVLFTLGTGIVSWFVYVFRSRNTIHMRSLRDEAETTKRLAWELWSTTASGIIAGVLFWLCAYWIFPDPVSPLAPKVISRWPLEHHVGLNAVSEWFVCFGVPLVFFVLFLQCALFVGFSSHRNEDYDREWWARASAWVLISGLAWSGLSLVAIFGPVCLYLLPKTLSAVGGAAGLFALIAGHSDKTPAKAGKTTLSAKLFKMALGLAIPLFLLLILAAISLGTTEILAKVNNYQWTESEKIRKAAISAALTERQLETVDAPPRAVTRLTEKPLVDKTEIRSLEHLEIVHITDLLQAMLIIIAALAVGIAFSLCIGVNAFSMHSMYRNRLIRAYLGASRAHRTPNLFTGFDPQDNIDMHLLRPEMLWAYSFVDFDGFVRRLVPQPNQEPKDAFLWALLDSAGTQNVLRRLIRDKRRRREALEALFVNINALLDRRDLDGDWDDFQHGRRMTLSDRLNPLRSLRNRRFLDQHYADDIYPHPMPLLCANDVVDADALLQLIRNWKNRPEGAFVWNRLRPAARDAVTAGATRAVIDAALAALNDAIKTGDLTTTAPFSANSVSLNDRAPFTTDPATPLHKFIENRLLIDKLFTAQIAPLRSSRPMHVVNAALNLVSGENLGWQERKAESFTFSPSASGSLRLGYRETKDYGEVSLGTAVTISGAAASPNMGYHSSTALALLMTLFNVRLGWWLGNPGVAGNRTHRRKHPHSSIGPLVNEAVANTNDRYEYVYLSDGGHFDNLGLYEMVLRRCHDIVVSDAGADEDFNLEDLGNAIRKIRIDLGVRITIDRSALFPRKKQDKQGYCAVGTIHYDEIDGSRSQDNGRLLYIKPAFYESQQDVPKDIYNYAQQNLNFPHESTADQFFSESQFESYRTLGAFAVEQICPATDINGDFTKLFANANTHLDRFNGQ